MKVLPRMTLSLLAAGFSLVSPAQADLAEQFFDPVDGGLNYFRISKSLRGGVRLNAEAADSDVVLPPFAQPAMSLRGVPAARYQGTHVGVIEGEDTVLYIQAGSAW